MQLNMSKSPHLGLYFSDKDNNTLLFILRYYITNSHLFKVTHSLLGKDKSQELLLGHHEDFSCYLADNHLDLLRVHSNWINPMEVSEPES